MIDFDTRLRTYAKAFFSDWLTGMSGSLSVPFTALAVLSSSYARALWVCLAVLSALVGSYRVWKATCEQANTRLATIRTESTTEIGRLTQLVAELSKKPYAEELGRTVNQMLDQMTYQGWLLVRYLLMNEPVDDHGKGIIEGIPVEVQNEQLSVALKAGIVQRELKERGTMSWVQLLIRPQFRGALEDILIRRLQEQPG